MKAYLCTDSVEYDVTERDGGNTNDAIIKRLRNYKDIKKENTIIMCIYIYIYTHTYAYIYIYIEYNSIYCYQIKYYRK